MIDDAHDIDVGKVNDFSTAIINATTGLIVDCPTYESYRALRLSLVFAAIYVTHSMNGVRMDTEVLAGMADDLEDFLDEAISKVDD